MASNCRQHPHLGVNPKTILPRVSRINADKGLSPGEKVLLSQITIRAGERGVIYHRNPALAKDVGLSMSQMKRYLRSLKKKNLVLETSRDRFRYLCPWPHLEAKLAGVIEKSEMTGAGSQNCPGEVVISDHESGSEKRANVSEFPSVEPADQDSKRKSENKREKKINTLHLRVRDGLDKLDPSWLRKADQNSFLKHLDNLTEKKIGVPALWEEYEKMGIHDAFVRKSGELASRLRFLEMLKQRCKPLGFR